ncbi:HAD-IA family hydrolase [soil metagenome]
MPARRAVIFDVGRVLVDWEIRFLYERLIPEGEALDAFVRDVVTPEWHFQHDLGRPFAETSSELSAQYPQHAELIAQFGPRFNETNQAAIPGMPELLAELDSAGVPLFAITNFSGEFFPSFRVKYPAMFDRFRDIVVSGDEKMMKPDPAIYRLALDRFGLRGDESVFIDDNLDNVAAAATFGIHAIHFIGEPALRAELVSLGLL